MSRVVDPILLERISDVENRLKGHLTVPGSMPNLHPKVAAAKMKFESYKPHNKEQLYPTGYDGVIDIATTPKLFNRAIRIMNTLIRALERLDYVVDTQKRRGYEEKIGTYAFIGDDKFQFDLRERFKREFQVDRTGWRYSVDTPSGELILRLNEHTIYEWKDAKKPIETVLSSFIAKIELRAEDEVRKREEYAKYAAIHRPRWEAEKRIAEELKANKENEKTQLDLLFKSVKRWRKAQDIRDFVNAKAAIAESTNTMDEGIASWIAFAYEKADWFDPNIQKEVELLKDVRREEYDERDRPNFHY